MKKTVRMGTVWMVALLLLTACRGPDPVRQDGGDDGADELQLPDDGEPDEREGGGDTVGDADADGSGEESELARLRALAARLPGIEALQRQTLVDEFLREVAYGGGGWPIREGGQLGFALWDASGRGGRLTVAGDFNGWDALALPLEQPAAETPFFYRIVDVSEPLPRTLYKLVRDGAEYFADPLARRFGYDEFGAYSLAEVGEGHSHLERWPAFVDPAGRVLPRDLLVYVPGAAPPPDGYPVILAQDGQNLFDPGAPFGCWQAQVTADDGIARGELVPFVLVGVANTAERFDEYTHVPDDSGGQVVGGRGADYVAFLAETVVPFVDARYATAHDPSRTGVMGSSLGGLVSFYAVTLRPEAFGPAASLSGYFSWGEGLGNPLLQEVIAASPPHGHRLYLDCGGGPAGGDNYQTTVQLRDQLLGLGWVAGVDLFYVWEPDAEHNEATWARRLPGALRSWFPGGP